MALATAESSYYLSVPDGSSRTSLPRQITGSGALHLPLFFPRGVMEVAVAGGRTHARSLVLPPSITP